MSTKKLYCILPIFKLSEGPGFYQIPNKDKYIHTAFFSKAMAIEKAEQMAAESPMVPCVVMESILVVEARKPEILKKEFTKNDELLPRKPAAD